MFLVSSYQPDGRVLKSFSHFGNLLILVFFQKIKKNVVPSYRLRWKLMDESRSDLEKNQEKLLYNVKPVNKVVNYRVRNRNNPFF